MKWSPTVFKRQMRNAQHKSSWNISCKDCLVSGTMYPVASLLMEEVTTNKRTIKWNWPHRLNDSSNHQRWPEVWTYGSATEQCFKAGILEGHTAMPLFSKLLLQLDTGQEQGPWGDCQLPEQREHDDADQYATQMDRPNITSLWPRWFEQSM